MPDVAVFPRLFVPTASAQFGPPAFNLFLPVWAQKDWGKWSFFGGGGYGINPGPGNRDFWLTAWRSSRDVTDRLRSAPNFSTRPPHAEGDRAFTAINGGAIYKLTDHWSLLVSGGPGDRERPPGRPLRRLPLPRGDLLNICAVRLPPVQDENLECPGLGLGTVARGSGEDVLGRGQPDAPGLGVDRAGPGADLGRDGVDDGVVGGARRGRSPPGFPTRPRALGQILRGRIVEHGVGKTADLEAGDLSARAGVEDLGDAIAAGRDQPVARDVGECRSGARSRASDSGPRPCARRCRRPRPRSCSRR